MRLLTMIMVLAATLSAGFAQAQDVRIKRAFDIFGATCVNHFARPADLRARLAPDFNRLPPRIDQIFLRGAPGETWGAIFDGEQFTIISYDDGSCAVFGQNVVDGQIIDHESMRSAFRDMMAKLAQQPGVTVKPKSDSVDPKNGNRNLLYAVTLPKAPATPIGFVLSMPDKVQGRNWVRLTIGTMP